MASRDDTPLPSRNIAILLASGVILISLAIVLLGLLRLLRELHLPTDEGPADERDRMGVAGTTVIAEIERSQHQIAEEQG